MDGNLQKQRLRNYPEKLSIKNEIAFSAFIVLLGMNFGFIAQLADKVSVLRGIEIGEIGSELGMWVFAATLIAAFSRYPVSAAINVLLFLYSMLFAYYLYGYVVLGFFPRAYFMGWLIIATLSPIAGFIVWYSRARGIVGSITTALPAALLFAHGYPAIHTSRLALYVSILLGVVLCTILPQRMIYKIIAFAMAIPIAYVFFIILPF